MPIPGFDRHGLLPAGTYCCSMTEVESRFGWNRHRKRFVELLRHFLLREIRPRFAQAFFVNGSFVTDKEEPGDVDVVLDMRAAHDDQKWQALVLMRDRQEQFLAQYGVHFWVNFPGENNFVDFFRYVGNKTARFQGLDPRHHKGILRVV